MDIEALNTFLTLANTKNYTRTAAQLFVSVYRDKPHSRVGKRAEYRSLHAQQPQRGADRGRRAVQGLCRKGHHTDECVTLRNQFLTQIRKPPAHRLL